MFPRWLKWTLIALLSWGGWGVLSRVTGDAISGPHSQVLSTLGMIPILAWLLVTERGAVTGPGWRGRTLAFAAGMVSCAGNVTFFAGLQQQGARAATVIPMTALAPLVTTVLAIPLLRERLNRIQVLGVTLSILAIYLFNNGIEQGVFSPWLVPALCTIVLWGTAGLFQKMSTSEITGQASMIWFLWAFIILAGCLILWQGLPTVVTTRIWQLTFAMGFTLGFGNLAILLAFSNQGKASIISPLCGLYPLVSLPLAIVFLGESISRRETLGIIASLLSVAFMACETPQPRPFTATSNLETKR